MNFVDTLFDDTYFMRKALALAKKALSLGEIPVGALIVSKENKIIAQTHNLTERLKDVTAHAEMQAITAASHYLQSKYLKGCTLYVTLEPCAMCLGALYWSQIDKIVYGASDPKRGGISQGVAIHPKTKVVKDILAEESEGILRFFFENKRKQLQ